jgi:transposase
VTALLNWVKISRVRGEQTVRRPRRNHSAAFKAKVALEAIRGEQPLAELATKFDVHATQIAQWKAELLKGAEAVFDSVKSPPDKASDLNRLHAKIGQLTLENDFLESALTKAGLLSAKR